MKLTNKKIIIIEWSIIVGIMIGIIIPDWNKVPVVKDYFALLIIGELIIESYNREFGEMSLNDVDLLENIADLICESKKVSKSNIPKIVKRLNENKKIVDLRLDNFPIEILDKMNGVFRKGSFS